MQALRCRTQRGRCAKCTPRTARLLVLSMLAEIARVLAEAGEGMAPPSAPPRTRDAAYRRQARALRALGGRWPSLCSAGRCAGSLHLARMTTSTWGWTRKHVVDVRAVVATQVHNCTSEQVSARGYRVCVFFIIRARKRVFSFAN
jgi:hypothetical protein